MRPNKSVTLIELIVASVLFSIIVLTISGIDLFSRSHIVSSERITKLQNEVSYVLDHTSKEISRAIGNERINGPGTVVFTIINPNDALIRVYIDANGNGQREPPINNPTANQDHWLAYRYDATGNNRNQIRYCGRCQNNNCNFNQCMDSVETLSNYISGFTPSVLTDNFVDIQLTARWQPAQAVSPANPEVTMRTKIKMPSVSTN